MRLYVDSADLNAIERALATGYVHGVTINPTLLRRAGLKLPATGPGFAAGAALIDHGMRITFTAV